MPSAQHRRHRNRDRTYPHRGQVNNHEVRRVRHHHQHSLFRLHAGRPQPGRGAPDPVVQLRVGEVAGGAGQRDPLAVARGQPPVEQVLTGVEQLRHRRRLC